MPSRRDFLKRLSIAPFIPPAIKELVGNLTDSPTQPLPPRNDEVPPYSQYLGLELDRGECISSFAWRKSPMPRKLHPSEKE